MSMDFDHLVVMVRDKLDAHASRLQGDGFGLTDVSVHNLGSINRLVTLESSYIELLGWPAGQPPARKEIAEQPLSLDALVFRPQNAGQAYEHLRRSGFDVNPVQRLERPLQVGGSMQTARFDTVRFARQPVPGLRLYYCEHLTPEYIWNDVVVRHENGARSLDRIMVKAADAHGVAAILATLIDGEAQPSGDGSYVLQLPNLQLIVQPESGMPLAHIAQAMLGYSDGAIRPFNTRV